MHPLKSPLSEAARERKVRGRSLSLTRGRVPGGGGERRDRRIEKASQGLKSFPLPGWGVADGKERRVGQGEEFCPGGVLKGKTWNNNERKKKGGGGGGRWEPRRLAWRESAGARSCRFQTC